MRTIRPIVPILAALAFGACRSSMHETADAFKWSDQLPAGATLHLRDLQGSIHVVPTNDAAVSVRASKSWRGREPQIHFVTNRRNDQMYVCAVWGTEGRCDERGYTMRGRSGLSHFLSMFSLRKERSRDARVDFEVALPAGVKIDASTVMGDVAAEGVSAGSSLLTVNGDVRVAGAGSLSGKSVNGDVTIAVTSLGAADTISATSTNGEVEVTVPPTYEGAVELHNVNGEISTDLPISTTGSTRAHTLSGTIGNAPRLLKLSTVNGEVRVKKG